MKKAMIIMLALALVSVCFTACTGGGGEITYTGGFVENTSSTNPDNMMNTDNSSTSSTTAPVEENTATTVLVPLTTVPGGTVPTVLTTEYTTEGPDMNYTPIDVSTTIPPVNTTYVYHDTTAPTTGNNSGNTTTTKKPDTTAALKKVYVEVYSGDTFISLNPDGATIDVAVSAEDFGIKMKASKGKATVNVNGKPYKVSYTVAEKLDVDDCIAISVDLPAVEFVSGDDISVTMAKESFTSTKNVSNEKFTTMSCKY